MGGSLERRVERMEDRSLGADQPAAVLEHDGQWRTLYPDGRVVDGTTEAECPVKVYRGLDIDRV